MVFVHPSAIMTRSVIVNINNYDDDSALLLEPDKNKTSDSESTIDEENDGLCCRMKTWWRNTCMSFILFFACWHIILYGRTAVQMVENRVFHVAINGFKALRVYARVKQVPAKLSALIQAFKSLAQKTKSRLSSECKDI
uniref:Uncharacterized protein n=1 Tax=Strigamia maritima TaxID=126957 RepID=T1IQU9_STRMM